MLKRMLACLPVWTAMGCAAAWGGAPARPADSTTAPASTRPASTPASAPAPAPALRLDLGASVSLELILVPSGTFMMGSMEAGEEERPVRRVRIERPYYLGRYEITNAQFRRFRPSHDSGEFRGESLNGDTQPVVQVSWEDASAFCEWLSMRTGRNCRLPRETEWEYACRAGAASTYSWGNELEAAARFGNACDAETKARFRFSWAAFPKDDHFRVTAPVGSFKANSFGLHDLHGNVWEWCADLYLPNYDPPAASSPATQTGGADPREMRIHRGGSWVVGPNFCRCAARGRGRTVFHSSSVGFRVAADAR